MAIAWCASNESLKSMKRLSQITFVTKERTWVCPLFAGCFISLILYFAAIASFKSASSSLFSSLWTISREANASEGKISSTHGEALPSSMQNPLPRLAYFISGSRGDGLRIRRLLQALYHPRNQYLLHLDLDALPKERVDLAIYAKHHPTFTQAGNVQIIGKSNLVSFAGPTTVACTMHGASILLRMTQDWDWFINLSASDYPLVTQDELLHVFSYLPRDLNFIEHTSDIGWKEFQRARPMIIDPSLYLSKKQDILWASEQRPVPDAFKLFLGSPWVILTRSLIEYCVLGWDNLPRTVLMYFSNVIASPEGYFHTVACNAREFQNTTANNDLHYIAWDSPPKPHPISLGLENFHNMTESGAAFGKPFEKDDPVLDKIDKELLGRSGDRLTPGSWCVASSGFGRDPCRKMGHGLVLKPGSGAKSLQCLIDKLLAPATFRANQCKA